MRNTTNYRYENEMLYSSDDREVDNAQVQTYFDNLTSRWTIRMHLAKDQCMVDGSCANL